MRAARLVLPAFRMGDPPQARKPLERETAEYTEIETLRAELLRIRLVTDKVPSMLAYWDSEQRCRFANAAYERWFGVKPETILGGTMADLLGPIYPLNRPHIEGALAGEPQHFEREIPDPAGGPPRYSQADYVPDVVGGTVRGFAVVVSDITARRELELRLREARAEADSAAKRAQEIASQLERVLGAMAEGLLVQDGNGRVVASNAAATRILEASPEELRGQLGSEPSWRTIREDGSPFPSEERPPMQARRTGKRVENVSMGLRRTDGSLQWMSVTSVPRVEPDGSVSETVTTFHDVTQIRNALARAAQQDRLAMAGTLAAGVGHEINNPLTYVVGNLEFALEEVSAMAGASPSARLRELIEVLSEAREGADRIRKIVRGLRTLSREDVALRPLPVASAIETALSIAGHELRNKATVVVTVKPDLPLVTGDESRLTQVLVNLVVNAAQAFERAEPEANRIAIHAERADSEHITITVHDNGPGIPGHLRQRVFDPFFTTKPVGEGTGLGLSVSRSLLASMNGELRLEEADSQGASFVVTLPVASEQAEGAAAARVSSTPSSNRARIAVIDDEPVVLRVVERVLSQEHDVVTFSDPREALAAIEAGQPFDLVLCDLMLPYLSGEELFNRVRAKRPALTERFVFMTGGQTDPSIQAFLARVPNERIHKPFPIQHLLAVARRFAALRTTE
jgi:PAS domain S-box-containing protein